jgi:amino acid adenylation domain-containing protein
LVFPAIPDIRPNERAHEMSFEPIHHMVERAASRFPGNVAVECPEGQLTYADLQAGANHLAHQLQAAGAGPGGLVPILAEDRREVIIAVLAVLQAGAAFAPLDPQSPRLRLGGILEELSPKWVLLGAGNRARDTEVARRHAPSATQLTVYPLGGGSGRPKPTRPAPDDECYVFFTSGSTGRPKGIVGRLKAVDHYIRWETEALGVEPGWRVSNLTSPSFDAMLRDIFLPLCSGGTVCAPPPGSLLDPHQLSRWIDSERVNLVHCVPAVFRGLARVAHSAPHEFEALRWIALAGEKLSPQDVGRWRRRYGERIGLVNLYGPSEATMTKTYHFVTPADAARASIPIGVPMPDTEALLVGSRNQLCPEGEVGELYLRTPYLTHGYHGQPDATSRVFVPNPVTGDSTDIVYRTGDFARRLPGGELEFLGRQDHQVKIGGVRVELEDVESALRETPAVHEAAAVLDQTGEVPRLCAFVEVDGDFDQEAVLRMLRARLPSAAIPASLVVLDRIPRTVSGKTDRRSLPLGLARQNPASKEVAGPRTPTERALAELLREVAPSTAVDVRADLLDLGGNSLLIMHLLLRLTEDFGIEVPLQTFLAAPTLEAVARWIDTEVSSEPLIRDRLQRRAQA